MLSTFRHGIRSMFFGVNASRLQQRNSGAVSNKPLQQMAAVLVPRSRVAWPTELIRITQGSSIARFGIPLPSSSSHTVNENVIRSLHRPHTIASHETFPVLLLSAFARGV